MPDLLHEISVQAPPERVYAALTTPDGLRAWWTVDVTAEERVGGRARFGFNQSATVFHMRIEELTPFARVIWSCQGDPDEWKDTTLTWQIAPVEGGSILQFRHGGWRAETRLLAICNSSWGELMHRIKAYAEGKNPGPHWTQ
ncbi:MAG: SRPBCC domain-containing protein [Acidobacteriia bacterium]|nr:SRPBCC domain-containing protein [Terriglobia bacterium]